MTDAPQATGGLSVADAVGLLDAAPAPAVEAVEPAPAAQPAATESEPAPTGEDELDPELLAIEDEPADDPDPAQPAIEAPRSWDAAERATFAQLPREAQQIIAAREGERDKAISRAQTEAAEVRQRAEAELKTLGDIRQTTQAVLQRAAETFKGKWDNVDWSAWAQQDPAAYVAGKAQFEAEQSELARLNAAHQQQQQVELQRFQTQRIEELKTLAPHLFDPEKGAAAVQKIETFLVKEIGVDPSIFPTLNAKVIKLAEDGMRYRELVARAKNKPPASSSPAVRPAASAAVRSPQRATEQVASRFAQTKSVDDAVALLDARTSRK